MKVQDIMTKNVVCISDQASLKDAQGKVEGIVTSSDFVKLCAKLLKLSTS